MTKSNDDMYAALKESLQANAQDFVKEMAQYNVLEDLSGKVYKDGKGVYHRVIYAGIHKDPNGISVINASCQAFNVATPTLEEGAPTCLECVADTGEPSADYDEEAMPWGQGAVREALERMGGATWDFTARTLKLPAAEYDDGSDYLDYPEVVVTSLEELCDALYEACENAFYEDVPRNDGEWADDYDHTMVEEAVQLKYDKELTRLGWV